MQADRGPQYQAKEIENAEFGHVLGRRTTGGSTLLTDEMRRGASERNYERVERKFEWAERKSEWLNEMNRSVNEGRMKV